MDIFLFSPIQDTVRSKGDLSMLRMSEQGGLHKWRDHDLRRSSRFERQPLDHGVATLFMENVVGIKIINRIQLITRRQMGTDGVTSET